MNSTKKITQKTSGTHKKYKPGQLVTINHRVYRITKKYICMNECFCCFDRNYEKKGNRITDGTQSSSIGEK